MRARVRGALASQLLEAIDKLSPPKQQRLLASALGEHAPSARPLLALSGTEQIADLLATLLGALDPADKADALSTLLTRHLSPGEAGVVGTRTLGQISVPSASSALAALFLAAAPPISHGAAGGGEAAAPARAALSEAFVRELGGAQMPARAPELFTSLHSGLQGQLPGGEGGEGGEGGAGGAGVGGRGGGGGENERLRVAVRKLMSQMEAQKGELASAQHELVRAASTGLDALEGYADVDEMVSAAKEEATLSALQHEGKGVAEMAARISQLEAFVTEMQDAAARERRDAAQLMEAMEAELVASGKHELVEAVRQQAKGLASEYGVESLAVPATGDKKSAALAMQNTLVKSLKKQLERAHAENAELRAQVTDATHARLAEGGGGGGGSLVAPMKRNSSGRLPSGALLRRNSPDTSPTGSSRNLVRQLSSCNFGVGGESADGQTRSRESRESPTEGSMRRSPVTESAGVRFTTVDLTAADGGAGGGGRAGGGRAGGGAAATVARHASCSHIDAAEGGGGGPAPPRKRGSASALAEDAHEVERCAMFGGLNLTTKGGQRPMSMCFLYRVTSQMAQGKIDADRSALSKGKAVPFLDEFMVG